MDLCEKDRITRRRQHHRRVTEANHRYRQAEFWIFSSAFVYFVSTIILSGVWIR